MSQHIPLAWKQLTHERMKFLAAIAGVLVAVMLMWVQLGILAALYDSATAMHRHIRADLVVIHAQSENMNKMKEFSNRSLYRFLGHPDVDAVGEIYCGNVDWQNVTSGEKRGIFAYGIDLDTSWLDLPGIKERQQELNSPDVFLFDQNSKKVFGPVVQALQQGELFDVEINNRRVQAIGMTALAISFGVEGNLILSKANFLRLSTKRQAGLINIGLIRLHPGSDTLAIQQQFRTILGPQVKVLTVPEFVDLELYYWKTNAPVGFVFTMGTIVGFFIGFIVVYQILYTDVTNHLPQFATMKAMGFTDRFLLRLVLRQALLLAILGFIPGSILAIGFYQVVQLGTSIPVTPTWERGVLLFFLTCLMCFLSGSVAVRKLRAADPADVF